MLLGKGFEQFCEIPRLLDDAAAIGGGVCAIVGAAPVTIGRPEGEAGDVFLLRKGEQFLGVGEGKDFGSDVVQPKHGCHADHAPELGGRAFGEDCQEVKGVKLCTYQ